jgi:hypothetical protein
MNATAPLFADLPVPEAPSSPPRAMYCQRNKALRTARDFCNRLVEARDPARKALCYRNMIAAVLAKDGV